MGQLPIPANIADTSIAASSQRAHSIKAKWDSGNEISGLFTGPWLLQAMDRLEQYTSIADLLKECSEWENASNSECARLQQSIDDTCFNLYQIESKDRAIIENDLQGKQADTVWPQQSGTSVDQKKAEHVRRLLSFFVMNTIDTDEDGIVPFVDVGAEMPLMDRVRQLIDNLVGTANSQAIEAEISFLLGRRMTIELWLAKQFFKYHVALYKRRPIFWHVTSDDGSFGVVVHYHRFNLDRLKKLRSVYLNDFIQRTQLEIGRLAKEADAASRARVAELEGNLQSARTLDERLRMIEEGEYPIKVPWKGEADQPKGWRPDLDDGVKVNIAPFEAAGVLAVKKVT